jgi:hypothetical protein
LLPAGAVAGWGLHPLESAAFARRTPKADFTKPPPEQVYTHFDCWKQGDFFAINHHQKAENIRRSESAIGVIVDPH